MKHKTFPVMAFSGTEEFLRVRAVRDAINGALKQGRDVTDVKGEDHEALQGCLSGGFLFSNEQLVVVSDPVQADIDLLNRHFASGDTSVVLILDHEGAIKKNTKLWKNFLAKLPKGAHFDLEAPPFYKREEYAVAFTVGEAKRLGKGLSKELAGLLVRTVGPDLGVLSFEVLKVSYLLDSLGLDTVGRDHLTRTVGTFGIVDVDKLITALGEAHVGAVLQRMNSIRLGYDGDPTIMVCGKVGNRVLKWMQAASMDEKGASAEEMAQLLDLNPYYLQKEILPVARVWKKKPLMRLFHNIVSVEKGLKNGHCNPWTELEVALVGSIHLARRGR